MWFKYLFFCKEKKYIYYILYHSTGKFEKEMPKILWLREHDLKTCFIRKKALFKKKK